MSRVPAPARVTAKAVAGHLARRRSGRVEAWYVLGEQNTSGLTPADEYQVVESVSYALSRLPGYRGNLRCTSRPFQVEHWARELVARSPDPLPDSGGTTFADWVENQGRALADSHGAEPLTMIGLRLNTQVSKTQWKKIARHIAAHPWDRDLPHTKLAAELVEVDSVMGMPAVNGRRATTAELDWLLHRSHVLGVPAPAMPYLGGDTISEDQMRRYVDPCEVWRDPREKALTVEVVRDGHTTRKKVAILAVSTIAGRRIDPLDQSMTHWMSLHRLVGMPEVEWAVDFTVVDPRPQEANLLNVVTRLRNIANQVYREQNTEPPLDLKIAESQVMRAHQDATSSDEVTATWVEARMYLAVPGETDDEVQDKVKRLTRTAARAKGVELTWAPRSQYAFMDAFQPGVTPPTHSGLRPTMPVRLFATGLPHASASLGDGEGPLVGRMHHDRNRPVLVDLHTAHRRDIGGTVALIADQGSGKTTTLCTMLYNQVQMGDQAAYFAPDGQGARLGLLPEIAPYFQHIDLTGKDAEPGVLAVTQLIPPVSRRAFPSDDDYRKALFRADRARATLVYERLEECLPHKMRGPAAESALTRAIGVVGTDYGINPWLYLNELHREGGYSREIANLLIGMAEGSDEGMLMFPTDRSGPVGAAENYRDAGKRLTVVSMQDLKAPRKDAKPDSWTRSQRLFFPIMASAAYLTARMVYADFTTPTTIAFDEGKKLARTDSGMYLMTDLAENASRKHKAAVIFTMLDPQPLEDGELTNLVKMWWLGHMDDVDLAEKALRLMGRRGVDARRLAEQTKTFARGEWFMRDVPPGQNQPGRFGRMHWTMDHQPHLLDVLTSEKMAAREPSVVVEDTSGEMVRPAA